jgi:hypothetical protein
LKRWERATKTAEATAKNNTNTEQMGKYLLRFDAGRLFVQCEETGDLHCARTGKIVEPNAFTQYGLDGITADDSVHPPLMDLRGVSPLWQRFDLSNIEGVTALLGAVIDLTSEE